MYHLISSIQLGGNLELEVLDDVGCHSFFLKFRDLMPLLLNDLQELADIDVN